MAECYLGEIRIFAGNFAPAGWHFCDGTLLSLQTYQALFALLGTTYGGNGQTNFQLPDLRGRLPVHTGQGTGLSNYVIGQVSGTETVTLLTSQLPPHTHNFMASASPATSGAPFAGATYASVSSPWTMYIPPGTSPAPGAETFAPTEIQMVGLGQPHDNMMPGTVLNYIIALEGLYPQRA